MSKAKTKKATPKKSQQKPWKELLRLLSMHTYYIKYYSKLGLPIPLASQLKDLRKVIEEILERWKHYGIINIIMQTKRCTDSKLYLEVSFLAQETQKVTKHDVSIQVTFSGYEVESIGNGEDKEEINDRIVEILEEDFNLPE